MLEFLVGLLLIVIIVTIIGHWWRMWRNIFRWAGLGVAGLFLGFGVPIATVIAVRYASEQSKSMALSLYPSIGPLPLIFAQITIGLWIVLIALGFINGALKAVKFASLFREVIDDLAGWLVVSAILATAGTVIAISASETGRYFHTPASNAANPLDSKQNAQVPPLLCTEKIRHNCWEPFLYDPSSLQDVLK